MMPLKAESTTLSVTGKERMRFCTVVNCMDGRVQLPVIEYLKERFGADYVDSITEAGPNLVLSRQEETPSVRSIRERLKISVENHKSTGIAIAGHHDCAGNPAPHREQIVHVQKSVEYLQRHYPAMEIIGLWVDENWQVHQVDRKTGAGGTFAIRETRGRPAAPGATVESLEK